MGSRADSALASGSRRLWFSGCRARVGVALAAALVFAVHLLNMHSGHHEGADHDVAGSGADAAAAPVEGSAHAAAAHDPDGAAAGTVGELDVLEVEHPHRDLECGEAAQSRLGVTASALTPALGCLWVVPRAVGFVRSQGPVDLPRSTPHLVRELGVQRV